MSRKRKPGRVQRLRGTAAVVARRGITRPLARRLPLWPFRRGHRLRRRLAPARYTDADPLKLIEVDPTTIERSVIETATKYPRWGVVDSGDWDRPQIRFDERAVPRGIRERFDEGKEWHETALYDAFLDQLDRFGNAWGYRRAEAFTQRCREIEELYRSLQKDGYRQQADLQQRTSIATRTDEINVDIARDGTLCWRCYGQHRLALAKLLEIDTVPVLVHRRHGDWQRQRDRLRTAETVGENHEETANEPHPDLRDLRERS